MRRSIVYWVMAAAILAAGVTLFSTSAARSMQLGSTADPLAPQVDARTSTALIADRQPAAAAPARPTPVKPTPVKPVPPIRLGREASPRLCKALEEKTELEFVDAPLQDVVDFLKDRHQIEIQIDVRALEDASVGLDTPVSCRLKDVTLGAALDLVLQRLDLTYTLDGDVVLITIEHSQERQLMLRLYDCSWAAPDQLDGLIEVVQMLDPGDVAPEATDSGNPQAGAIPCAATGFKVVPLGSRLAVRATCVEHEAVRRLLAELRAGAGRHARARPGHGKIDRKETVASRAPTMTALRCRPGRWRVKLAE